MRVSAAKITRALMTAALLSSIGLAASASFDGTAPSLSGLSNYVISEGQPLTITGQHFASDLSPNDCTVNNDIPTVKFAPLDGSPGQPVQPQSDSSHCSNTTINIQVPPGFGGNAAAANVSVTDSAGHPSNNYLVLTLQPTASISPPQGPVGTQVTLNGVGLHPLSATGALTLTQPGGTNTFGSWGSSFSFTPGNNSGSVQVSFAVNTGNGSQPTQSVNVSAGNYSFQQPVVSGISPGRAVAGQRVTINGSNLGHGGTVSYLGGVSDRKPSWTDSSHITTTVPVGTQSGPITITINGWSGPLSQPTIALDPLVLGVKPGSATGGGTVTISGYNFGFGTGVVTVGGTGQTDAVKWLDTSVRFNLNPKTDAGDIVLTRADGAQAGGPRITIVPHLSALEANNVVPGTPVVVDGVSLGAQTGTAKIGTQIVPTQLWSRSSVLVAIPTTLKPGTYPLVLTSATGVPSNALSLTVVGAPAPGQAQPSGARPSPNYDLSHNFVKPIKPPSPVDLSLDAEPKKVAAGGLSNLTVTLKLNGKPVAGAEMKLSMIFSPATDYAFSPDSGVTDQDGVFKATVRISKTAGDNIILAQSGIFSDQDRVQGAGANGSVPSPSLSKNPANGVPVPLLVLGASAIGLVLAGLFVNLRSHGYV